jgi:uncharacterized protein YacL
MGIEDKNFIEFNKEIFYGEIGAILGAALVSTLASHFTMSRTIIAQFTVIGSMIGGSSLLLMKKIQNKIQRKEPIFRSIIRDLEYFTPAAALIGLCVGYPIVYYLAKFLVKGGWHPYSAGALAEVCAFIVFLVLINTYRLVLVRKFKRDIV